MTRPLRIVLMSAGTVALILVIGVVSAIVAFRSGWIREKIRERVVAEAEKATGGKVEIGALQVDWRGLTAEIDNLVIHGTEPAAGAPLLAVKRVVIGFKVLSFLERKFNVASVQADNPRAHVIIEADGTTNLPSPKVPKGRTGPQEILALKIGRFELTNGVATIEREGGAHDQTPWNARGENLTANVTYDRHGPRYDGGISIAPLDFVWNGYGKSGVQVAAQLTAKAAMERNRVTVSAATVKSAQSEIDLSGVLVNDFRKPVITGDYTARVSLAEADRIFRFVNFQHNGLVSMTGKLRFVSPTDYTVSGTVRGTAIGYGPVRDMRVAGNVTATPDKVLIGGLVVNALGGELRGDAEIRKLEDFHIAGKLDHFDAQTLAGLGGVARLPYNGVVSGPFDATGQLREESYHQLVAGATLDVAPAEGSLPVHGNVTAKFDGLADTVELGRSWLELPHTRVDVSGVLGQSLEMQFQSHDLNDLAPALRTMKLPARLEQNGSVAFNGTVTGALRDPHIAGHATVQNGEWEGQKIDSLAGDFTASRTQATVNNMVVDANQLRGRITGSIGLADWKPVDASAVNANVRITDADAAKLLALAGESTLPVTGTLNTTAQVTGTVGDPHVAADLTLTRGRIHDEPYDRLTGHAQYLNSGAQTLTAEVDAGRKRVNATLRLDRQHSLSFNVSSNALALADIAAVRKIEPDLRGTAQFKAEGAVDIGSGQFDVRELTGDIRATGLALGSRALGDATLTAETKSGVLTARLESNIARSAIHGDGTVRLTGDYPVNAKLTFSDLGLSEVSKLLRAPGQTSESGAAADLNMDGSAAGELTLSGPAKKPDEITAAFDVTQFELHPLTVTGGAKNIADLRLRNNGPIRATLAKSVVHVESARFTAPSTDLAVTGSIALNSRSPFDLQVKGTVNLGLAQTYNPDLTSSGELMVNAAVHGSLASPDVSGRAELAKGDFHYADFSNGLANANGVLLFNGARATIQSFSAESGGGKVDVTGFAALNGGLTTFRLEAKTRNVRVRYPPGVSTVSDSEITLAGTTARSEASGKVTVRRVSVNPKADISTILVGAAQPMKTTAGNAGFLANLNLDVQVETAPDVAFETSVTQSLEADANLRLRGTAAAPAVLGRIDVTQGDLVFLNNKYTINQGVISFFNPAKIEPVLNVDLQTKARGVDVTDTVTGPINNLHPSHRSDPPLQFGDIVALLATGRSPTDPTLATANTGQSLSVQQLGNSGASALVGQAISNPVGGPLQRFFGVSRVKIDPQLTGITGSPEARLTVEQQVSPEILFTYITDVSSTSTQLIRVEWDFSRQWAAIVTREENGYVGVDFAFKKRFR